MFYYPHILTFWMYAVHCSIHNLDRTRFSTRRKFATARENLWLFYGIFAENCIISTSSKLNENQQTDAMQLPFNGCNNERGYGSVSSSLCSMLLYVWFIEFVKFWITQLAFGLAMPWNCITYLSLPFRSSSSSSGSRPLSVCSFSISAESFQLDLLPK